jgi:hypothetical protein
MTPNHPYKPLDAEATERTAPSTVGQFLTLCLLGAREEAGFPSNEARFDEDVNVYLAGLLVDFLEPQFHSEAARYLHSSDQELASVVRHSGDERFRYRTYRINADHLLLAIGLFHHVENSTHRGAFRRDPREFLGRGSAYYLLASSSLRRLRRQPTAIEIAMNKLSVDLERYVAILRRVRTSYFHLTERLGEGTLFHLSRSAPMASDLRSAYDAFLDQFSCFQREATPEHHARLEAAVQELRRIDPEFSFELPARPMN